MTPRGVGVICVLTLLAGACTSVSDDSTGEIPTGDSAAFCTRWPEVRVALAAEFDSGDEEMLWADVRGARHTLDEVGALVPASLRSDWESAIGYQETVIKLLEIADYVPERLPRVLIDAAFGEGGAEAAASASAVSIERVDAWAFDECGDFCELWPRLDRALGFGSLGVGGDMEWQIITDGLEDEALILLADGLVPDEVREDWDAAADMKLSMIDLYRSWDWEPPWERLSGEEVMAGWLDAFGLTQRSIERYFDEHGGTEGLEVDPLWWVGSQVSAGHREVITAWSADNCEVVGASGMAGTVRVEGPAGGPDRLLMAAVPRGADLGEIDDASDFLGVACSDEHWVGQSWSVPLLDRDGDFNWPCTALHMSHVVVTEALLPAGDYDLFVGTFPTGFGDFDVYVPAPETCAVVPFTVDGDIQITVPDLEPCGLGPLAGSAEEIAWRQPPPTPVGPTGTLWVVLTEYFSEGGERIGYGMYRMVVLPHGTTLNDVGIGEVWPVGSGCLGYRPLENFDRDVRATIVSDGVPVPISGFPVTGDVGQCVEASVYLGFEDHRVSPDPVELAAGDYDIYLVRETYVDGDDEDRFLCATLMVSVSGETVVEAPPLEDCP